MEMSMRLALILFLFTFHTAAAPDDDLGVCKIMTCGKGRCNANHTAMGQLLDIVLPTCECDPGWTQPNIGFSLPFLPCVIPNCSFDATCTEKAPSPGPSPRNSSNLLDPCAFSLCGEGSCEKTSEYGYRCNCEQGYENLLNMTAGLCIRECSIGADCSGLGISVGGNRTATPPQAQDTASKGAGKDIPCWIAPAILSLSFLFLFRI